jgi:hypothetical protein
MKALLTPFLLTLTISATAQEDILIQIQRIVKQQEQAISNLERVNQILQEQQANGYVVRVGNMTYAITPEDTLLGITERQTVNAGILYIYANETCPSLLKSAKTEAGDWKERYQDEVTASAFYALGYTRQLEATEATVAEWKVKAGKRLKQGFVFGAIVTTATYVVVKYVVIPTVKNAIEKP